MIIMNVEWLNALWIDKDKFISCLSPLEKRDGKYKDFDHLERISCTTVYESHRSIFEAYNSNKYNSTGVIQWMINNAFPSNIWNLYDYYFTSFPAYFSVK